MMLEDETRLNTFLKRVDNKLIHYSPEYIRFLKKALSPIEVRMLTAFSDSELSGIMPIGVCRAPGFGTVVNSLPFFGSHGGAIAADDCSMKSLLLEFRKLCEEVRASAITVIENPFLPLHADDIETLSLKAVDDRIGQFTELPADFSAFHVKTRNAIRKGQKLNQSVACRDDPNSWKWMQKTHEAAILNLGGIPKSMRVFDALRSALGGRVKLWIGSHLGSPISGLVALRYGDTIEYFTPVVDEAHRNTQALSALIYEVMEYYADQGAKLWNWGGTWRSQVGVYRFKNRWNAFDKPYRYFNCVNDTKLIEMPIADLLAAFPNFYIYRYTQ